MPYIPVWWPQVLQYEDILSSIYYDARMLYESADLEPDLVAVWSTPLNLIESGVSIIIIQFNIKKKLHFFSHQPSNMHQSFESQKTLHSLPSQVSYVVSLFSHLNILQIDACVMMDDTVQCSSPIMMAVTSWVSRHWSRSDVWWYTTFNLICLEVFSSLSIQLDIEIVLHFSQEVNLMGALTFCVSFLLIFS